MATPRSLLSITAACLALALPAGAISAQAGPPNGPRSVDPRWHAFVHATLVPAPGQKIDDATVVIRDGVIVSVAAAAEPPAGARVWDCRGRWIHAGLIEPYLPVEAPDPEENTPHAHWNPKVAPQRSALDGAGVDDETRAELRALGFAAAALAPEGGVFRGRTALVLLDDPGETDDTRTAGVVRAAVHDAVAFDRSGPGYPRSLMGCAALVRQTLLDADWYAHNQAVLDAHPEGREPLPASAALAALGRNGPGGRALLFETEDELEALLALRIAGEFERPCVVVGSGTEYRRLAALAEAQARLILPLAFPDPPRAATVAEAEALSLRELMSWEQAPTNPRRVAKSGLLAALTTHRLERREDFRGHLLRALQHGLSADDALAMLTTHAARLLGAEQQLGEVAPGRLANLVVSDGPLFEKDTEVLDVWVRGQRHVVHDPRQKALEGSWSLTAGAPFALEGTLVVAAENAVTLVVGEEKLRGRSAVVRARAIDFLVDGDAVEHPGVFALHAVEEDGELLGTGRGPDGAGFAWNARRVEGPGEEAAGEPAAQEEADDDADDVPEELPTPLGAFGATAPPPYRNLLVLNATLWGVGTRRGLEKGGIAIRDGKIAWLGPTDVAPELEGYEVLDAEGKHITPGLIDCHSHTGISKGVNEGTQAVTAEVRIFDALDPDDINWYRQLAGGVTAVHQLHGSANPIGGQSSVVKLRWGVLEPEDMYMRGAKPGIKFALGENVKRSGSRSRGGDAETRYPASRMGVEALMRDRLLAALDYSRQWARYQRLLPEEKARTLQPRRDLELDALAEVLGGIRMVHCHSYRQDEILMLCRLAKEFGFRVGTFQHGLEGYKVAEAIADAADGASVFSDWWAYKFEVFDAIPYNGEILHRAGVVVSFNSDSSELARRLNTEAAKAVKYGGIDPKTALTFVTLGPAFQLGVEGRVGSLALGKDADFAIWSDDPLSTLARCEATYIDGRPYFTLERDRELRAVAAAERQRILQKVLRQQKQKKRGADAPPDAPRHWYGDHLESGADDPGVCGCETWGDGR